ncbi:MAG: ribose 5-phosphate isomerase B [Helicobacteraceae bacterium]|jgi:ribose 5-phosphate isomerase B|nr:ribose 5-phosphate isomerase B [Helicobacteraceae bacterium]
MKSVVIGNDHAAVDFKREVADYLIRVGYEVVDVGCNDTKSVDYPDIAEKVAAYVQENPDSFGVLVCGTGIGMSIAANKYEGIRAALCHNAYTAQMARSHNNANILCMGSRVIGTGVAQSILKAWLDTAFAGGRHGDRLAKIDQIEARKRDYDLS